MNELVYKLQAMWNSRDDEGATAVEYGLLVALIAVVIIVAVGLLGGKINAAFTSINSKLP
jgi:pilus assembly protein Flp/PilA